MSDPIDTGDLARAAQDGQKPAGLKPYSLKKDPISGENDLKSMSLRELLHLRDQIDTLLPATDLKSLNLVQLTLLDYYKARELLVEIQNDTMTPVNQKAQVMNTVRNTLAEITRMRNEVYNGEQFRMMEAALAKALKKLPKEAQDMFFEAYGKLAEDMAVVGEGSDAGPAAIS